MKRLFLFAIIALISVANSFAQKGKTLMTIGKTEISSDEFMHIYSKNNSSDFDKKTIDEYIELFVNFKLKVIEAERLKLDTAATFRNELAGYREQLAKPYLTESEKAEQLMKEAYGRSSSEVKIDHIFIKVSSSASEKDVTLAKNKAMSVIKRLNGGEEYEKVVLATSDDKGASKNKGHLWFMPLSKLPYPIQNYASSAQFNKFSEPIRTKFGFHIVRLVEKRKAQGQIKVAHIMIATPRTMTETQLKNSKVKIDSIYKVLKNGADFATTAKLSEDPGTAAKGGELPWFSTGRMVPEFERAAFALTDKSGFSKPVKTDFGWHILRLVDKKTSPTYSEQEKDLRRGIERDAEKKGIIKAYVSGVLKKEYNFKQHSKPEAFYTAVDTTIFDAKWDIEKVQGLKELLFTIDNIKYSEEDFAHFLSVKQVRTKKTPMDKYINSMYEEFIYTSLTDVEKSKIEDKHPKFGYLMREYHDGILLFDLTDEKVWSKAVQDSAGLEKFYNKNIDNYKSQLKLDMSVYKYTNAKTLKKAEKILSKKERKHYSDESVVKMVSKGKSNFTLLDNKVFSKGENPEADKVFEKIAKGEVSKKQRIVIISDSKVIAYINDRKIDKNKKLSEIKGIVIADYQNHLEEIWIKELRKKYPIKINDSVLKSLK